MPIIKVKKTLSKEKIKEELSSDVMKEIKEYCAWAEINDIGFFIEEAALFVFLKDKEWKSYKRDLKRANKQK